MLYADLNSQFTVKFFVSTSGRKRIKLRISRLWKTLQILSEASLCCPISPRNFCPIETNGNFLLLTQLSVWDYRSMEKNTVLTFLTGINHHRTHLQTRNQTKTPLEKNPQTDFSSTEYIYTNTQLQTSKQKPNHILRNCKMGNSPSHS